MRDTWVQFRIEDVDFPPPATILWALHGGDLLAGRVVGTSDRGHERDALVMVQVSGLERLLILPAERVTSVPEGSVPVAGGDDNRPDEEKESRP